MVRRLLVASVFALFVATTVCAQPATVGRIRGRVADETGGVLPGVTVELRPAIGAPLVAVTSSTGEYSFDDLARGVYQLSFSLPDFATLTRADVKVVPGATEVDVSVVLHMSLSDEVTVSGKRTFTNLADVENPAENLVGIAQSASQGAITADQLAGRPMIRPADVLETVPGVIVSAHASGGKAPQYFLRGFNLDHGTDFATSVEGMPVNLPTHAHGQGYTDLNFMIPELVSGIQFSKGPYFADHGDFATAGASNISYVSALERPIAHLEGGTEGWGRVLFAASPAVGDGHLLAAFEYSHSDGPWTYKDNFQKFNGVLRYAVGNALNGFTLTGMASHGQWTATNQVPERAIASGLIGRFGSIDPTDGATTYRDSISAEWRHGTTAGLTKVTAYGFAYDLSMYSNFTFFLDDPVHGDQIEQQDHRFTTGGEVSHRRFSTWWGHPVQNTFGVQVRNDDIPNVAVYHTEARTWLNTVSENAVLESTAGAYAQSETEWAPWLRSTLGLRFDGTRFRVDNKLLALNSGTATAGLVSPKAGLVIGPWKGTEYYVNVGEGFHSNDARGATAHTDPDGNPIQPVTPLVRAQGAEVGVRSVVVPHLQSTLTVWTLRLASELVWDGDTSGSIPSRPSERDGVEFANYYSPKKWLTVDADVSWSRARFTEHDPVGDYVPEAVGTVISVGARVDNFHRMFASLRCRYFGPRTLTEDNLERSQATSLVNLEGGYLLRPHLRLAVEVFNLLNAQNSDIDYYYVSRLPGEPLAGVAGVVTHPTNPRAARVNLVVGF